MMLMALRSSTARGGEVLTTVARSWTTAACVTTTAACATVAGRSWTTAARRGRAW
jgi:hypothetical protein